MTNVPAACAGVPSDSPFVGCRTRLGGGVDTRTSAALPPVRAPRARAARRPGARPSGGCLLRTPQDWWPRLPCASSMPLLRCRLPRAHAVRRTPGRGVRARQMWLPRALRTPQEWWPRLHASRACHCCAAGCLEPMRCGVRPCASVGCLGPRVPCACRGRLGHADVGPARRSPCLSTAAHPPRGGGADAQKPPPPCWMAARRARKRATRCALRPRC